MEEEKKEELKAPQKKKSKKKRRKKHYFLRLLVFVLLIAGAIVFLRSDFFCVKHFQVTGNRYYTTGQIKELCGINTGKNLLFETKLRPARDRLLDSPYIKIATLSKKLPSTVVIEVEERSEFAAVPMGEQYLIIDDEGLILRVSNNDASLPVIAGMVVENSIPGTPLSVDQSYAFSKSLKLLSDVARYDLYFERLEVSPLSIKAYIYYDRYCCEGTMDNIMESLSAIKVLIASLYQENISHGTIIVGSNGYLAYQP